MKTHPQYKDRIALRFDGPPRPDGPQLLGVELNGQLISRGEWAEDDNDEWLLFLPREAKGKGEPGPGYGENDLTVPFRVILFIRNRAKKYRASVPTEFSAMLALRSLANGLESLKDSDLSDGEPPLCQRTLEAVVKRFGGCRGDYTIMGEQCIGSMAKWAEHFVRGMAQEAKGDDPGD